MKVTLCTSPHLNRGPLFDGRDKYVEVGSLPLAQTFVPMGLLSLAGSVAGVDVTVQVFDINKQVNAGAVPLNREFYPSAAEAILAGAPDVVGLMTDCDSFHHVLRMCSSIKARAPNTTIVLGCVHASYNASQILHRYSFIDYVVKGEGEVAFAQLLEALRGKRSVRDVGNLWYRDKGEIRFGLDLPLIPDLDSLPMPDMSLVSLDAGDAVWIEIGRGCPFKCNFCVTAPYWNRRHRIKSPQRILTELRFFRDRFGRRDFNFTHDLFTTDRRWVLKFSAALAEAELGVTWTCSSRTDTLDEEQLAGMAKAGCRDIYFGVESGTAGMQAAIDKGLGLDEARRIIDLCHRYGVSTTVGFIAGLPGETEETLTGTLLEATSYLRMNRTAVHLFGYGPYRGSNNFADIERELLPELHFVDFPLDKETDTQNRALIQAHRDVFARYSRLDYHRKEGFDEVLEVAEEYFPILNAVPQTHGYLIEAGVEPYDLLFSWARWLTKMRRSQPEGFYHAHQGSIDDFLAFVVEFAELRGIGGDRFDDLLRWERLKQLFRSRAPETLLPSDMVATGGPQIRLNPTARLEQFRHAPPVEAEGEDHSPASFAFFRRRDGEASIVRVGSLATAVMEIASNACDVSGLTSRVEELVGSDNAPSEERAETVHAILEQLIANEVVFLN